ncbi:unnamed protein product [Oikopleura dioica]|uniref:G-protein coupled receptors family 1 profile domain-containing protein n=1 Tax=Oikopleura dioica TaxID=34765 RepID=E4YK14_OIKDI|nr:unnamed protein product [Oikopleura dioica]
MSQVNSPTFTEKFVASVYLVMFIVGFTANMLVILVLLLTHGSLKAPAGLYVLHLAVADSLLLISLPFAADNRLRGTWIFGRIACKLMESMKLLNFFSSIFLLTLMVCRRVSYKWRQSVTNSICAGVWLVSILTVAPLVMYSDIAYRDPEDNQNARCIVAFPDIMNQVNELDFNGNVDFDDAHHFYIADGDHGAVESHCLSNGSKVSSLFKQLIKPLKQFRNYMYIITAVGFVIPLAIVTFCYANIISIMAASQKKLNKSDAKTKDVAGILKQMRKDEHRKQKVSKLKGMPPRRKVTVLVANLVISFVCCWLPFHFWHIVRLSGLDLSEHHFCAKIRDLTFWLVENQLRSIDVFSLAYSNSVLNPLLYSFLGYGFRNKLIAALTRIKLCFRSRSPYRLSQQGNERRSQNMLEYL